MFSHLVFLGSPGAGKSTQAAIVTHKLEVPAIGTGAIFREAMSHETPLGKEIGQFINSGLLVPDKLTNAIVVDRLRQSDCAKGFILDGYPRSLNQAKSLDTYMSKAGLVLDKVLFFKVDASVVSNRLGLRRVCMKCHANYNLVTKPAKQEGICDRCSGILTIRADDNPDSVRKRLQVYEEITSPLLSYYEETGRLEVLDASKSVDIISKNVATICGLG